MFYNGVQLQSSCWNESGPADTRPHHIFLIGDWGGLLGYAAPGVPTPADRRSNLFPGYERDFVIGADDSAQVNVSKWMAKRAEDLRMDYVINVGDNFYWGGIMTHCGKFHMHEHPDPGSQWWLTYEQQYGQESLRTQQWLSVLGNHDYGGFKFTSGWDQPISYTWAPKSGMHSERWVQPAQFYAATAFYEDFSIDWFFVDSNAFDSFDPEANPGHNLCSKLHNDENATCNQTGPSTIEDCPAWFMKLWLEQIPWLEAKLKQSTATWQIVVTHFPPEWGADVWKRLSYLYGIDLIIVGHRHMQEVYGPENSANFLAPTSFIVTGGGGGITSENVPSADGNDDMYGFVDLTLGADVIKVEMVSHGGFVRNVVNVVQRPHATTTKTSTTTSTTQTSTTHTLGPDELSIVDDVEEMLAI